MLLTIIVFLLILSVLVLIHELGHFLVAKKLGIKVEEFGFGFPPKAFSIKRGETEYSINWLPIGGFVKLYGEDEAGGGKLSLPTKNKEQRTKKSDEKRAFYARPVGQRTAVVIAGVVMNALLAVIIYYGYLSLSGFKAELPLFGEHKFFLVNQNTKSNLLISSVSKNSPAEKAGIRPFSRVVFVDGITLRDTKSFIEYINQHKGKEVLLQLRDIQANKDYSVKVTPRVSPPKGEGAIGVAFFVVNTVIVSYDTLLQKAFSGFIHPANLLTYNFNVLGKLVSASIKEGTPAPLGQGVSGPVGIYSLVGSIIEIPDLKERILQVLNLAGLLSISLAFFNILPIPALDGGRLFFIFIEAVSGKKVNQRFESLAHAIGMAILLALLLLITLQDISKLFR